jgi:hypothetical protein
MASSLSSFIQRAGRAARDPRRQGQAILLFEKRVLQENLGKGSGDQSKSGVKIVNAPRKATAKGKTTKKPSMKSNNDFINHADAEDEGLGTIALAQTCRRELIASVYDNELDSM